MIPPKVVLQFSTARSRTAYEVINDEAICESPPGPSDFLCCVQGPPYGSGEQCNVVGGDAIVCTPDYSVDNGGCPANNIIEHA